MELFAENNTIHEGTSREIIVFKKF